ncbi:MAG: hypothetical protein Q7T20_04225 [Saprospiraceae bacterium]|nr:hypothetical protein [Saprospiraceae bacterium]
MAALKLYDEETIERFVLNQMPDDELDAFLTYLVLHPDIQADIDLCRERIKAVRGTTQTTKTYSYRKWLWITAILTGLVATWFFLPETTTNSPVPTPPAPVTNPSPAVQKQEPFAQNSKIPDKPKNEYAKTLAAAYRPNQILEIQLNSTMRGAGIEFFIKTPAPNERLKLKAGKVGFQLSGTVKQDKIDGLRAFRVLIFDNQQANVEAMRFITAYSLPLIDKGNGESHFQLTEKTKLALGLYYYIIIDDKDEWQFVGSFRVE